VTIYFVENACGHLAAGVAQRETDCIHDWKSAVGIGKNGLPDIGSSVDNTIVAFRRRSQRSARYVLYFDSSLCTVFNLFTPSLSQFGLHVMFGEEIIVGEFNGCSLGLECNQTNKSRSQPHGDQYQANFLHLGNLLFFIKRNLFLFPTFE
jgi:hypothetical protein